MSKKHLDKEQADKLDGCLKEMTNSSFGSVQVNTSYVCDILSFCHDIQ